ncbi:MAG: hypothetical protein ACI8Y4_003393 [Candidatus Poriferisodalaceae bacterium]
MEPSLIPGLSDLSERQRVSVLLVRGSGWTHRAVAEFLGVTPANVQRHVERALAKLRRAIGVENRRSPWPAAPAAAAVLPMVGVAASRLVPGSESVPSVAGRVGIEAWDQIEHDDLVWARVPDEAASRDGISGAPGLVAVGWVVEIGKEHRPDGVAAAMWTSEDRISWHRLSDEALRPFAGAFLGDLISFESGLIAIGAHTSADKGPIWTATDGSVWCLMP